MSGPGVIEALLVDEFIVNRLGNDATLKSYVPTPSRFVYSAPAPDDAGAGPFVTHNDQAQNDVRAIGTIRIMGDDLYLVKVVKRTSSWVDSQYPMRRVAERIDVLLHGASGSVTGGVVLACVRVAPFRLTEVADGAQWRHLGGVYRFWAQ